MSAIIIPSNLEYSYNKLTNDKTCYKKLNAFLRSSEFSDAMLAHRRTLTHIADVEYRATLEALLSFYKPGETVGINQLAKNTIGILDERFEDRRISQNEIINSFCKLLRDTGAITGESPLLWSWLDAPTIKQRMIAKRRNFCSAYLTLTDSEAKLKKAYREATALRKMEQVILDNRSLMEDIGHQLEVMKKMDTRNRDKAIELGIPYSQVKEDVMKKRKGNGIPLKSLLFPGLLGIAILTAVILSANDSPSEHDPDAGFGQVSEIYEGLNAGENIWRNKYIELYKQYGTSNHSTMEAELFGLAAEYMISMKRMKAITATISHEDVAK